MLSILKSLSKKKKSNEVIEKIGDRLIIKTHFDDRVETTVYKKLHTVTEYKTL